MQCHLICSLPITQANWFLFYKVHEFQVMSAFGKKCRNIWGSVRHKPSAMFKKYSRQHNNGIPLGFIKSSECRMAGEHIALLRLLCLQNALKATVTSKEFTDLRVFKDASDIDLCDDFWKYLFVLCRALYAPMRVLRLADQKTPAMDKLYFYVLQTDEMLPKWLSELDSRSNAFLNTTSITTMENVALAGESDNESDDSDDDSDDSDDDSIGNVSDDDVDNNNNQR
jgi:hypothetical protein